MVRSATASGAVSGHGDWKSERRTAAETSTVTKPTLADNGVFA